MNPNMTLNSILLDAISVSPKEKNVKKDPTNI